MAAVRGTGDPLTREELTAISQYMEECAIKGGRSISYEKKELVEAAQVCKDLLDGSDPQIKVAEVPNYLTTITSSRIDAAMDAIPSTYRFSNVEKKDLFAAVCRVKFEYDKAV